MPILVPHPSSCRQCGKPTIIEIRADKTSADWQCLHCNAENTVFLSKNITIGFQLLQRAGHERGTRRDYAMSIILSAMAVDCELSRLYTKWKTISSSQGSHELTQEHLEELLRKLGNTSDRIRKVCALMHPAGIVHFIKTSPGISGYLRERFTPNEVQADRIVEDIAEKLFWPRNRIIHNAFTGYGSSEAFLCHRIAALTFFILLEMDATRQKVTDPSLRPS